MSPPLATPLATIGYEGATQADVIARLRAAGVEIVIDVRAVASSRRPGFSKTILAASLAEAGIDYLHLRALGTPKPGREAARAGRIDEMREIYEAHLATPEAVDALAHCAAVAARSQPRFGGAYQSTWSAWRTLSGRPSR